MESWYDETDNYIIVEELLLSNDGYLPVEFKVYCFNNKIKNEEESFDCVIRVIKDREIKKSSSFYTMNWEPLDIIYNDNPVHEPIDRPDKLPELLNICRLLSQGFSHIRIDFMYHNDNFYVGELTFADTSGFIVFNDRKWDLFFGNKWKNWNDK
jgi:hypothetical protein